MIEVIKVESTGNTFYTKTIKMENSLDLFLSIDTKDTHDIQIGLIDDEDELYIEIPLQELFDNIRELLQTRSTMKTYYCKGM